MENYSTPEGTYNTYVQQAKSLRVVADHRNYRRAIRCFTASSRKWFEKNYDSIEFEKDLDLYNRMYRSKKLAYVFSGVVVMNGPSVDKEYKTEQVDPDTVLIEVEGYPEKIKVIRTKQGWQIKDLFGIQDRESS